MASWQITGNKFDFSMTHSIEASQDIVYRVLADMEAYPEFINDLVSVQRAGELYRFVARAAILTIPASLKVTQTPEHSVTFELVEGPVDLLNGSWRVEAGDRPGQTRVTLTIHAETGQRGEWLLRMTARFVENKTGKLIAAFSERVLEMERSGGSMARPTPSKGGSLTGWLKRLWACIFGQSAASLPAEQAPAKPAALFRDEHQSQTLEALATTMLPPDDFDQGAVDMGFASVVEMRARYEAGRAQLYATALPAVDKTAQAMFNQPNFVTLTPVQRTALLEALRQDGTNSEAWGPVKPSTFFRALWEDVSFLYCTHPGTWQRIGFPGPSFDSGGYQDFDQPQKFMGRKE